MYIDGWKLPGGKSRKRERARKSEKWKCFRYIVFLSMHTELSSLKRNPLTFPPRNLKGQTTLRRLET